MAEIPARLVLSLTLGAFIVAPSALIAFIYGLATRRSLSEAALMAAKITAAIVDFCIGV